MNRVQKRAFGAGGEKICGGIPGHDGRTDGAGGERQIGPLRHDVDDPAQPEEYESREQEAQRRVECVRDNPAVQNFVEQNRENRQQQRDEE